jgi:hypothetical protein
MNLKNLAFAVISPMILWVTLSSLPQENYVVAQMQESTQVTSIDLSFNDLNKPLWLTIRVSNGARIQGQIKLDGRVIQSLNSQETKVNLSSYLKRGQQEISVTGSYSPIQSSVMIELNGENNQVSQQSSGNGSLNQVLIIGVR